jgi:hypothetical protein
MHRDYNTQRSKENSYTPTRTDYINYLYKECKSKLKNPQEKTYEEIIKFIQTPEGQKGFDQFQSLNPEKLGIETFIPTNPFKKVFQL